MQHAEPGARTPKQRLDAALHAFEDNVLDWGGAKRDVAFLVISALALLCSFVAQGQLPLDPAWVVIVLCGLPIILGAIVALVTEFDIKADVLVSLAIIASVAIGEYDAAGVVAFIMQIGGFLEETTVGRARAGIERLVGLTPRTARVVDGGTERTVAAEEVAVGQLVRVLPGEAVPVDGVIEQGQTSIDQSIMTGESLPVDKQPGDEVFSGTVNQLGAVDVRASRAGDDGSIQRMVRLVQSADAGKAKVVRTADAWATVIVVAALTIAAITWLVTGEVIRAVTVLVVFCPCALVLATPTAIMASIGNATRHGFLTREGDALERLARVTHVVFDKTGTLTKGRPELTTVTALDPSLDASQVLWLAASAEQRSEHPLGRALVAGHRERSDRTLAEPQNFELMLGRGVRASVDGHSVLVGNRAMMDEARIPVPEAAVAHAEQGTAAGHTVSFVTCDGTLVGLVALADQLRPDSRATLEALRGQGLVPVLLTGDNAAAAHAIAAQVGIEEVQANCLPEDKMERIRALEADGARVCMLGDGVNDAPALKQAHVGIAMGGVGSDIAADASDIVLVDDGLGELAHLTALSRRTLTTIRLNLTFAMTVNIVATALATLGVLGPVAGALVHNIGSVLVIVNSARLLGWGR